MGCQEALTLLQWRAEGDGLRAQAQRHGGPVLALFFWGGKGGGGCVYCGKCDVM